MNILVDTPVWSLALRRRPADLSPEQQSAVAELEELVREGRVALMGVVRQEVLSGIASDAAYERLREHLRAFPDVPLTTDDYEDAAAAFNQCRAGGITGSAIDILICAVAARRGLAVFTRDADFSRYSERLGFGLHKPR